MPHLRVPEMLVGSLLAIASTDGLFTNKLSLSRANLLSLICLIVLFVCFFLTGIFVPPFFPGIASLIPCIAAAGLIYLNSQPTWASRLLSNGFVVWIGKISYSLYLWHWVILAWMRYAYGIGPLEPRQLMVAVLLMTMLSVLSYYFVEQPTRHQHISFSKSLSLYYLLPAALVLASYFVPMHREPTPEKIAGWAKGNTGLLLYTLEGEGIIGDKSKTPTVLITGDSYVAHLDVFFDTLGKREGWSAYALSISGQPYMVDYEDRPTSSGYGLDQGRDSIILKKLDQYDTVVLSSFWGNKYYYQDGRDVRDGMDKTLAYLTERGKKVYVVYSGDRLRSVLWKEWPLQNLGIDLGREDPRGEEYEESKVYTERIRQLILEKYPQVSWIDLTPYIPHSLTHGSIPLIADNMHLNFYGAEYITRRFVEDGRRLIEPTP